MYRDTRLWSRIDGADTRYLYLTLKCAIIWIVKDYFADVWLKLVTKSLIQYVLSIMVRHVFIRLLSFKRTKKL